LKVLLLLLLSVTVLITACSGSSSESDYVADTGRLEENDFTQNISDRDIDEPGEDVTQNRDEIVVNDLNHDETTGHDENFGNDSDIAIPVVNYCAEKCETAVDCITENATAMVDENNYRCSVGFCEFLGCLSDKECEETFQSELYGCDKGSSGIPTCVLKCSGVSDCINSSSQPLYDADNYLCSEGYCRWNGCNSDEECATTMGQSGNYVCRAVPGLSFKSCVIMCGSQGDCSSSGSAAFDADNYECVANSCVYKGCHSDSECQSSFNNEEYACKGL